MADVVAGPGNRRDRIPGLTYRPTALGGRIQSPMVSSLWLPCFSAYMDPSFRVAIYVRTTIYSTARPLKSRFLESAYIESVRRGQLEVVEVNDLARGSLEHVLAGASSSVIVVVIPCWSLVFSSVPMGYQTIHTLTGSDFDPGITAVIHTAFPSPGSMDDIELLLVRQRPDPRLTTLPPSISCFCPRLHSLTLPKNG